MGLIIEGLHSVNEADISIKSMRKDIEKAKNKLKKSKMRENFGDKEVRQIRDKYSSLMTDYYTEYSSLISGFEDWCATYDGVSESVDESSDKVLSDFKKGDKFQIFGKSGYYILKSITKKRYRLEPVDDESDKYGIKTTNVDYFQPDKKRVFKSKNGDWVIEEKEQE